MLSQTSPSPRDASARALGRRRASRALLAAPSFLLLIAMTQACTAELSLAPRQQAPGAGPGVPSMPSTPQAPGPAQPADDPSWPPPPAGPDSPREPSDPNLLDGASLFQCEDPDHPRASPARVRRLQPSQLRALWGRDAPPAPYVTDPSLRYSSYDSRDILDESAANQLVDGSLRLAQVHLDKRPHGYPECFWTNALPDAACLESWARKRLSDLSGRPAAAEDVARFVSFGAQLQQRFPGPQAKLALVAAVLSSPLVVYRAELGGSPEDEHGRRRLDAFELAHALSYALANTPAQRGLLDAARADSLQRPEDLEPFVRALLKVQDKDGQPILAPGVEGFFKEYLGYTMPQEVFKSGGPDFAYAPEHDEGQTQRVLARAVLSDQDVLKKLLTTREAVVFGNERDGRAHPRNAVYNLDQPVTQTLVELPAAQRAGILTQPSWLAAQSRNTYEEAHAVYRGYWIRKNLLCGHVPALPITADAVLPDRLDMTVRQRLELATQPQGAEDAARGYCWGCHQLMNPLGLPFEMYDHRGQYRHQEQLFRADDSGKLTEFFAPVQPRVTLLHTGDPDLDGQEVADAVELMHLLSQSAVVEQCFVRHTFRYFMGRPEAPEDACTLASMYDAYARSGGSFQELLVALFLSDTFLYRRDEPTQEAP